MTTHRLALLLAAVLVAAASGCQPKVAVEAPKEPITINLNVKIEHEIRVKVEDDLEDLFEEDEELFGELRGGRRMTRRSLSAALALVLLAALAAMPAAALSLEGAKAKGLVGEQADGYVGVVGAGSPEAKKLAKDVNAKRRKRYEEIAGKRGVDVAGVAALAGKKLVDRAPSGEYIRGSDGRWVQKR